MSIIGRHGISATTPQNVLLGAGTIHKNLHFVPDYSLTEDDSIDENKKYFTRSGTASSYIYTEVSEPSAEALSTYYECIGGHWEGAIIGATSGGNKVIIKGEFFDIELDGALVKVKGLAVKQGGTASIEVNYGELSPEILKIVSLYEEETSDAPGYKMYQDKATINEGDYIENFGFVGKTANDAKDIIVIFENALCTSGLEIEGKQGSGSVIKATMEAYAELDENSTLDVLPVKIYYPADSDEA